MKTHGLVSRDNFDGPPVMFPIPHFLSSSEIFSQVIYSYQGVEYLQGPPLQLYFQFIVHDQNHSANFSWVTFSRIYKYSGIPINQILWQLLLILSLYETVAALVKIIVYRLDNLHFRLVGKLGWIWQIVDIIKPTVFESF